MIAVHGVSLKRLRQRACRRWRHSGLPTRRTVRADRPQRRRQKHIVQDDAGLIPLPPAVFRLQVKTSPAGLHSMRRKIGYLPENIVLADNLTGLETLQFLPA